MYETHNPGFCFKRDGEQKNVHRPQSIPTIEIQKIRDLVFTDGEVDIEKIICLHLISAHRTETLKPARKLKHACKEHSPLERLIERSRRGYNNNEKITSLMPFYTLEFMELGAMGENAVSAGINDGRLAARVLINETIRKIIGTVINALQKSNVEKLKQLVYMVNDTRIIKETLSKNHISEFIDMLKDEALITSPESCVLTPPFKIKTKDLNIRNIPKNLEFLVKHIRQNVLQLPKRKLQKIITEESKPVDTLLPYRPCKSTANLKNKMSYVDNVSQVSDANVRNNSRKSSEGSRKYHRDCTPNFIVKNIKEASKVRRIEYDNDETPTTSRKRSSSSGLYKPGKLSETLPKTNTLTTSISRSEEKRAFPEITVVSKNENTGTDPSGNTGPPPKKNDSSEEKDHNKFHIKQTTCPACMQKWKQQLPSPKTPRIRTSSLVPQPPLKTNSINRISMLINKEMYKLESYDRKYSSDSNSSRKSRLKKEEIKSSVDNINVDPIDLARIEQEIKQRETQRKLQQFLDN